MKHVILISIDDLRFDCVGYQPDKRELQKFDVLKYLETPTLDRIAEKSLCFTQSISACTYTTASHASVLTGLYPPRHGVRALYKTKLQQDIYTLAEILKVFGYQTVMGTDTKFLFSPPELNRGFDHIFEKDDIGLLKFLEEHKDEKVFLFMHFYDVHEPFMYSENSGADNTDFYEMLRSMYQKYHIHFPDHITDSSLLWKIFKGHVERKIDVLLPLYVRGVTKFDKDRFKNFIENLSKLTFLDDGLLIIFSDHGEGKGTHVYPDVFAHGADLFDSVLRVPLVIHQRDFSHTVFHKLVSLVDIFPTVIELSLGKNPRDLLPYPLSGSALTSGSGHEYVYAERWLVKMFNLHFNLSLATDILWQRAVRSEKEKFILYGEPEFFSGMNIDELENKEFLRAVYRKLACKFEEIDEFMLNLRLLNAGDISKHQFLEKKKTERYELYDLETDPFEENPQTEGVDSEILSSYKEKIYRCSVPAMTSETIVDALHKDVLKPIVEQIYLDDLQELITVVAESKNLFNELIEKFMNKNEGISDDVFFVKCFRIFFGRTPAERELEQLLLLRKEGVSRKILFTDKIVQVANFGKVQTPDRHLTIDGLQRLGNEADSEEMSSEILKKNDELNKKNAMIHALTAELTQVKTTLDSVYNSKTWKLGQFYARMRAGISAKKNK